MFQDNANNIEDHPELELQRTIPSSSPPIDEPTCQVEKVESRKGHIRHHRTSTSTLKSLVELEQKVAIQIRAMEALKGRILASPPTVSILDEIKTHRIEMEATLATLTVLWCSDGSVATRMKGDLELQLQEGIEDTKRLKRVLTSTLAGPNQCKLVIDIEKPGENPNHGYTIHHTDVKNRPRLSPLLGRLRLPFTAKFIPSACPGQSAPLNSALKQLQAEVVEG